MDKPETWWVISGTTLMEALKMVRDGESPDMVYTELFANSTVERHEDD